MDMKKVSFLSFFLIWAKRQNWQVPLVHVRVCHWLEHAGDVAVLRCFRGFGKSSILAIYNAWRFYQNPQYRILHQSETDGTAYKTSRDTQYILRNHPLTKDLIPLQGSIGQWWVKEASDSRNASLYAKGILSNVTSARADECQNDDVEVPNNTQTPEAREKMRERLDEQTHILVPGGRKLFIGTPHTFDSLYDRLANKGADCLTIRMFEKEYRIGTATKKRYILPFKPEYVFYGIGQGAKLLEINKDYQLQGNTLIFNTPPKVLIDCYAGMAWPERFTLDELEKRRRETETVNKWDSQYQLHAKPITNTRLEPSRLKVYKDYPVLRKANDTVTLWLGGTQIVGAIAYWDCALGKVKADASALSLVLTDAQGKLYWQLATGMLGDLVEFDQAGNVVGGQVKQVKEWVTKYYIPCVVVETNGAGGFVPPILRKALSGTGCAVREQHVSNNKQKRILDALEPPLLSGFLWVHESVFNSPAIEQMQNFNPELTHQKDDYLDSIAGAILQTPVRIAKRVGMDKPIDNQWRPPSVNVEVHTVF